MRILYVLLLIIIVSCKKNQELPVVKTEKKPVIGVVEKNAMVVSAREEASKIGRDILKKGGNAFDAMVATEMALAVAYPYAGNLGGGGFMVYRKADGQVGAIDYREKAPLAAFKDMYLDENGDPIPEKSQLGAMAVGVPGTIAGIFEVHKKFGTLSIEELLTPVVALAEDGYVITEMQEKRLHHFKELFLETNKDTILYARTIKANDTLKKCYAW